MVELKGHEEKAGFTRPLGARHGVNLAPKRRGLRTRKPSSSVLRPSPTCDHRRRTGWDRARRALEASSAFPRSSSKKTRGPAIPGAIAIVRSCCTIRSGTIIFRIFRFPENWPVFTPKDKIGDWLEMYSKVMELDYWGASECVRASYDDAKKGMVRRGGARGRGGHARPSSSCSRRAPMGRPEKCRDTGRRELSWRASITRAATSRAEPYEGKRCVVVGSNSSAHDIARGSLRIRRRRHDVAALVDLRRQVGP